jgi:hypothetical protein
MTLGCLKLYSVVSSLPILSQTSKNFLSCWRIFCWHPELKVNIPDSKLFGELGSNAA